MNVQEFARLMGSGSEPVRLITGRIQCITSLRVVVFVGGHLLYYLERVDAPRGVRWTTQELFLLIDVSTVARQSDKLPTGLSEGCAGSLQ